MYVCVQDLKFMYVDTIGSQLQCMQVKGTFVFMYVDTIVDTIGYSVVGYSVCMYVCRYYS